MATGRVSCSCKHGFFCRSCGQRGFTLIELLVVMVVMGVALGLVMVQLMPDNRAPLREEAARLALLLENAGLEARASGRSLAWSGTGNKYLFLNKNAYGDWIRIDDDSPFRPRLLPEGVGVGEVSVEERLLKPDEYVLLSAHSFALPFRIRLSSVHGSASVTGKSTGDVVFSLDEVQSANFAP
ncbi:MAG: prepilin-type N-terminal cleavage/methylation domain-containing protein [Gallionellaceae bacterium]|jgi:general secretion pathway protein H